MKKYSILIVGIKCYYGHIREFVINLKKKNPLVEITLAISPVPKEVNIEMSKYVKQCVILKTYKSSFLPKTINRRFNILISYLRFLLLHLRNHFDIVDIHFVKSNVKHFIPIFKRMTNNIVITPWGSDVLRVESEYAIRDLSKIYNQAKYITVGKDSQLGRCVIEKFKVDINKLVQLGWGGEFFDYIRKHSTNVTVEDAKKRFGLEGKYVITCGYNTQKQQRHEDIINAVNDIKTQLPKNLILLFPFTYGTLTEKRVQYKEYLIEKCRTNGMDCIVIEDYLNMQDLLKLRMATDIFVHIQTTDAGSRCVMEYVACNKKVVHGSWINYPYLENYRPSCYFPVDKIEHLGTRIVDAVKGKIGELPEGVKMAILERGWDYRMGLWNDFFESLIA